MKIEEGSKKVYVHIRNLPSLIFYGLPPQDAITGQVSQLGDKIGGWFPRPRKRSRHTFIGSL